MKSGLRRLLVGFGLAAAVGGLLFQRYWYYLPGLIASIKDPVVANQPVLWSPGPETAETPADRRPPNVVLILADDLGWNDLTFGGGGVAGGQVATPNIDSIARDGVSFSNGYAGNATCAPSRAGILTGRYATRFGFEFTPTPVEFARLLGHTSGSGPPTIFHSDRVKDAPPMAEMVVPSSEVTIADLLRERGYRTLMLGKWHLGETTAAVPQARGFDETLGFLQGASLFLPKGDPRGVESRQDFDPIDRFLWANLPFAVSHSGGRRFEPSGYMTDYLGDEAARAIEANRNRPFFLYLAFNAPHTPLQALASDYDALSGIADHRLRVYGAMIRALDRAVGHVLEALRKNGLDRNTLVFFTSDNGGAHYIGLPEVNRPFRGWKATFFEGGIHVPFFARWPAMIPPGTVYAPPVGHVDIFATAAAAAGGAQAASERALDGVDLVPFVAGRAGGVPHESLYWRSGPYKTLLAGGWKLQVAENPPKSWLFHLAEDPTEQHDLAASQPGKLAEMTARLAAIDAEQAPPLWPSLLEGAVPIDHPLGVPFRPDDEYVYWSN